MPDLHLFLYQGPSREVLHIFTVNASRTRSTFHIHEKQKQGSRFATSLYFSVHGLHSSSLPYMSSLHQLSVHLIQLVFRFKIGSRRPTMSRSTILSVIVHVKLFTSISLTTLRPSTCSDFQCHPTAAALAVNILCISHSRVHSSAPGLDFDFGKRGSQRCIHTT